MKARVCDRCESVVYEGEKMYNVHLSIDEANDDMTEIPVVCVYGFGTQEVCERCKDEVEALARKMKLGPDKVKGGIRRRAKRGTGKPRKPRNGKKGEPKAPSKPAKPEE